MVEYQQIRFILRLIFKFVFGAACVYFARKKRKNEYLAFIAGALLGIFALIYYMAVNPKPVSIRTSKPFYKCRHCGEIFDGDKKLCPNCKKELKKEDKEVFKKNDNELQ